MKSADNLSKFSMYGVFMITLINFLISAFSGTNAKTEDSTAASPSASDVVTTVPAESVSPPAQIN